MTAYERALAARGDEIRQAKSRLLDSIKLHLDAAPRPRRGGRPGPRKPRVKPSR